MWPPAGLCQAWHSAAATPCLTAPTVAQRSLGGGGGVAAAAAAAAGGGGGGSSAAILIHLKKI